MKKPAFILSFITFMLIGPAFVPNIAEGAPIFSDRFKVTNNLGTVIYDQVLFEGGEAGSVGVRIPLNVGAPVNALLFNAYVFMVEPPVCPVTCPPETDPATPGTRSDLIILTVTRNAAGVPTVLDIDFTSDPALLTPPTGGGHVAGLPIVENGTLQNLTLSLMPRYPAAGPFPFKIEAQSCSDPCTLPEPGTLALATIGALTLLCYGCQLRARVASVVLRN